MSGTTFIADTADVVFRRKRDGHVVFTAEAQLAGITGSEESEVIRGGIGNKSLYTIRHSKDIVLNVRNATFDLEFIAMTQGAEIENGSAKVTVVEKGLEVVDGAVTIKDTPTDGVVNYENKQGQFVAGIVEGNDVTVEGFQDGDKVTVEYKKEVQGKRLILDASKFSETYEVEYRTIEYDRETEVHTKDIYFLFYNASPSGEYEINLENGQAFTPELSFTVKAEANSSKLGEVIEVDVTDGGDATP